MQYPPHIHPSALRSIFGSPRPLTMMSGSFQPSERGVVVQARDDGAVATGKQKCDGGFER